jgi:hypothetical protein
MQIRSTSAQSDLIGPPEPMCIEAVLADQSGGTARYLDVVLTMRSVSVLSGSALAVCGPRQLNSGSGSAPW